MMCFQGCRIYVDSSHVGLHVHSVPHNSVQIAQIAVPERLKAECRCCLKYLPVCSFLLSVHAGKESTTYSTATDARKGQPLLKRTRFARLALLQTDLPHLHLAGLLLPSTLVTATCPCLSLRPARHLLKRQSSASKPTRFPPSSEYRHPLCRPYGTPSPLLHLTLIYPLLLPEAPPRQRTARSRALRSISSVPVASLPRPFLDA